MKGKPVNLSSLKLANSIIHQPTEQIINVDEWSKDIINFRNIGLKPPTSARKLNFTAISQNWLKTAIKSHFQVKVGQESPQLTN